MNRNTLEFARTIYGDKTKNPGSAPHRPSQHLALLNLEAAVAAAELPTLPHELATILAARGKIEAFSRVAFETPAGPPVPEATKLGREITAAAFAGDDLPNPQDFTRRMREAWIADQVVREQSQMLQSLVKDAGLRTSAGISLHLDAGLDAIRTAVMAVVAKVRALDATLDGLSVTDATAVARATTKQRDAVATLPDLAREYNRLRMLQRDLLIASDEQAPGVNPSSAVRDAPAWHETFDSGLMEFARVNFVDHGVPHDLAGSLRMLAVARRADVWVPTIDEAEDAWQAMSMPGAA